MPVQMNIDNRLYSPDRDLAYCTPHLIMRAVAGLDPDKQEPWIYSFLEQNGIKNEDLVKAAGVIAKYINEALDPTHKQPLDALLASGFFDLPQPVQHALCAKIGQVMLSAFFVSIRDATRDPADPPISIKAIIKAAEDFQWAVLARQRWPKWLHWIVELFGFKYR